MILKDKLMLITGASGGIGAATARAAARRKVRLALLARSESKLAQAATEIGELSRAPVFYRTVDVGDPVRVAEVTAEITSQLGTPDIVLNNAGAGRWLSLIETEPNDAMKMMAAPYFGAFYITRAFLPAMLARHSGTCVFVNSAASRLVWPGAAAYTAARWAVRGLFESVRAETSGTGVRAAMVTFAKVKSEYWANNPGSEERIPKAQSSIPVLTVDQAAEAILKGLEFDREEIVEPLLLRFVLSWARLFPLASRRMMLPQTAAKPRKEL